MNFFSLLRRCIFWCHLGVGVVVGVLILIMAVSGILIGYERQITSAIGLRESAPPSADAPRLTPEKLLEAARDKQQPVGATGITLSSDAKAPANISWGRERLADFNPYTGELLGDKPTKTQAFFRWTTGLHRWLALTGKSKEVGEKVTAAANLAFGFLLLSGLYLWVPRKWNQKWLKIITRIQPNLKGKARDWNWHNVIGIWTAPILLITIVTGMIMAYPWANAALFRLSGNEPPPPQGQGGSQGGGRPGGEGGREGRAGMNGGAREGGQGMAERREGGRGEGRGEGGGEKKEWVIPAGLDNAYALVTKEAPKWESLRIELPKGKERTSVFTVAESHRGRPDLQTKLTVDLEKNEIVKREGFGDMNKGRQWRTIVRWTHTGEIGGFIGQTIAVIGAAGAAILVWTGLALAWRRFFKKKSATKSES